MTRLDKIMLATFVTSVLAWIWLYTDVSSKANHAPAPVGSVAEPARQSQEDEDQALGQYTVNMMFRSAQGRKLSDGKKQVLARAIVRVANDIFTNPVDKKAFVTVLEIESGFQRFAQSPTGPKGYSQVAKSTFYEALKSCGVTGLNDEDVWETDLNLYAGACYFRTMLERNNGDPFIAIVAYNQGPHSDSAKTYAKNGSMDSKEALKYVAKFSFLQRAVTDGKVDSVPAIGDLPTPGAGKFSNKINK